VWEQKLKANKTALKKWIKNPSDSPTMHRKQNIKQLLDLQMDMEQQDITSSKTQNEQNSKSALYAHSERRKNP